MIDRRFLKIIMTTAVIVLAFPTLEGKKIKQSLRISSSKSERKIQSSKSDSTMNGIKIDISGPDTVTFIKEDQIHSIAPQSIRFAGYDKPVSSSKESFHIINDTPFDLHAIALRIKYLDMKGRMLHSRDATIKTEIPHGETRKVDISSWDTQKSFYYHLSTEPKRIAAPYKVSIQALYIIIDK